ncbi:endothelial lipase-like [Anopheles marshallii]|uniref:endothelial lipase-like n=1 Tax=Anopheles marshallii TaxID=1521116 RepID=UPI00237AC9C2|nr:endothelial lipase-like [Anopheles marshallii]
MSKVLIFFTALLCGIVGDARGADLQDVLSVLTEGPLARLFDSFIVPAPRTTGFETLVPQKNIRLHCTKTSEPRFQEVFFGDINVREKLNFTLPLTIAIHGWRDSSNLTLYNELTTRYLRFVKNTNYCLLDWRPYAEFGYQITARQSAPLVANYLFGFLQSISLLYFQLENVSLIGFSMGGQIAGLTGKLLPGRIGAIYALDPAGPLFSHPFDIGPNRRIAGTDAKYVQVIYTSRYTVGFGPLVGTQNFLPNEGYHPQAPCVTKDDGLGELSTALRCSHQYAVKLFTDSLDPANPIMGQKCNKVLGVRVCLFQPKDRLGIYAKRIPGNFYL